VAGTIAAAANGTGITGVAPNARILPLRALGKCGGESSDIADAVAWAAGLHIEGVPDNTNKANVINLSLAAHMPVVKQMQQPIKVRSRMEQ
jgi:serine protease